MALIKYTSILNSFVSQEGSMGTYTNYIYYSVLVVYTDGRAEIVEGNKNTIAPLLAFLRTPIDELQDIKQTIRSLSTDISSDISSDISIISQKIDYNMNYVLDSLYPIPDVRGMKQDEAIKRLEECGLIPNIVQSDGSPDDKQVISFLQRNRRNFKYIDIGTSQNVPAVDGLTKDVAVEVLEKAGFQVEVKYVPSQEHEKDIVLRYSRNDNSTLVVELEVGSLKPVDEKLIQFFESIDSSNRFQIIARQWNQFGLNENPLYADIDKKIKSKSEIERMYGPKRDPQVIKDFIEELRTQLGLI